MIEGWDTIKENRRNWCWVGEKGNWGRHHCLIDFDSGTILKVRRGSLKSSWIIGTWWQFTGSAIRSRRLIRILLIARIFQRLGHSDKKLKNKIICVPFKNLKCYITRWDGRVGEHVVFWPPKGEEGIMSPFASFYPTETKCWCGNGWKDYSF